MIDHWFHLAELYHGLPVMDYTAVEVLADPDPSAGGATS